jgi:hypothetical protein
MLRKAWREHHRTTTPPSNLKWLSKAVYKYGEKLEVVLGARASTT